MTIIRSHNTLSLFALIEAAVYALLVASALSGVVLYNALVNLSHEIEAQAKALGETRVHNAEFKNQLFAQLDSSRLEALARERNLIPERAPNYFESDPRWLSVSR